MIYNPILKNIEKWKNKEYIYGVRYKWWYNWSRYANLELNQKLLEQDEFDTPTTTIDFVTGEPVHEISIFSFSENLGLQIEREFKELHINFQDKFLTLEKESQKKNFLSLISGQVGNIAVGVNELNIEDIYKDVLISEFQKGQEYFNNTFSEVFSSKKTDWNFKYLHIGTREGDANVLRLFEKLKNHNLIEKTTKYLYFKTFLTGEKPKDKIVWTGNKAELKAFILEMKNTNKIMSKNHWVGVDNCFLIISGRKPLATTKLNTAEKLSDENKITTIQNLIKEL